MNSLTVFRLTPINPRAPLKEKEVLPVILEQTIADHTGHHDDGPHAAGKAELLPDGRLRISIIDTAAGRHAIAMLKDDLLDAVLWKDSVRLRVHNEGGEG